ncbi:DUF1642 domain-containing protein [Streptococcus sp. S784/96/1]|uniref:DUF1642 domain-containing protein n=1 Tax=Streptococcus sp. S784/96/1 TaxID=2653499 RepID=UPI001389E390|nr:DUF1642 domain-containing protein [Streptococcus sp. S784/96/1]
MNKQEAIKKIKQIELVKYSSTEFVDNIINIINQINEPQKPKVPQVAVEFYERYKDDGLSLGEWFGDFYSPEAIEDFPRLDELAEWLHDNDNETNRQREFALATLVTFGVDAVEIEKEKLYWVRKNSEHSLLLKDSQGIISENSGWSVEHQIRSKDKFAFTEKEIKGYDERYWAFAVPVEEE